MGTKDGRFLAYVKVFDVASMDDIMSYSINGQACKIHPCRPGFMLVIQPQIRVAFATLICEWGIQLTNRMMAREAGCLIPAFGKKSGQSQELVIHHFIRSIGLTQQAATHTAQRHFAEMEGAVKHFIAMLKVKVEG